MTKNHRIFGGGRFVLHSLFQEGEFWYARVRDRVTGAIRKVSTREKNRRKAEQAALDWAQNLGALGEGALERAPLDATLTEWARLREVRDVTRAGYNVIAAVFAREWPGRLCSEVAPKDVEAFLARLADAGRKPNTRRRYLIVLRAFFRWAVRNRHALADPTEGLSVRPDKNRRGMALSLEQAQALVRACTDAVLEDYRLKSWPKKRIRRPPEHLRLAVLLSLYTGLRRRNVLELRWGDIDLGKGLIRLPGARMKTGWDFVTPLHPALSEEILAAQAARPPAGPDELVLVGDRRGLRRCYQSALERAGLPAARWHDLRHTFATWMETRCSYATLQALLGHRPGDVSFVYLHRTVEEMRAAVEQLPDLRTGAPGVASRPAPQQGRIGSASPACSREEGRAGAGAQLEGRIV